MNRSIIIGSVVIVAVVGLLLYLSRNKSLETDQQVQMHIQDPPQATLENNEPGPSLTEVEPEADENLQETGMEVQEQAIPVTVEQEEIVTDPRMEEPETEPADVQEESQAVVEETITSPGSSERDLMLTLVKDVAYQSTSITKNTDLQGLLAYQSYLLNKKYNGDPYDRDIYNALYEALKKLISPAYNIYPKLRNSIKAMVWLNRSGSILTGSSDGSMKILSGNIADRAAQIDLAGTGFNNECIGVSPDERVAAVGTSGGGMLFIELENRGELIHQDREQGDNVFFIQNLGSSGSFLSAGTDNRILKWDYRQFSSTVLVTLRARPLALATTADGLKAAIGTRNGKLYMLDVNNPSGMEEVNNYGSNYNIRALAFSPGQRYLAAGLLDGSVRILSGNGGTTVANLFGPGARVTDLEFSPDGRFLVAASSDGNVYMWNCAQWKDAPLVFTENNGFVFSVCFNRNSNFFYSGSKDYPRMVGRPTDPEQMVKAFCTLIGRNLTREEWIEYFGEDIPYEETCPR